MRPEFVGFWQEFINDQFVTIFLSDEGITVLESSYSDYGDYKYDLTMDTASPIMVYGLLFTCLISLMILFGSKKDLQILKWDSKKTF